MHKRIKEFSVIADRFADDTIQMPGEFHPDWHNVRDQKFAELIINECAKLCDNTEIIVHDRFKNVSVEDIVKETANEISDIIKLYFGIKHD